MAIFTVAQVAEKLHVSERTVRRQISAGALKAAKVGSEYRVSEPDLEAFYRACGGGSLGTPPPLIQKGMHHHRGVRLKGPLDLVRKLILSEPLTEKGPLQVGSQDGSLKVTSEMGYFRLLKEQGRISLGAGREHWIVSTGRRAGKTRLVGQLAKSFQKALVVVPNGLLNMTSQAFGEGITVCRSTAAASQGKGPQDFVAYDEAAFTQGFSSEDLIRGGVQLLISSPCKGSAFNEMVKAIKIANDGFLSSKWSYIEIPAWEIFPERIGPDFEAKVV